MIQVINTSNNFDIMNINIDIRQQQQAHQLQQIRLLMNWHFQPPGPPHHNCHPNLHNKKKTYWMGQYKQCACGIVSLVISKEVANNLILQLVYLFLWVSSLTWVIIIIVITIVFLKIYRGQYVQFVHAG